MNDLRGRTMYDKKFDTSWIGEGVRGMKRGDFDSFRHYHMQYLDEMKMTLSWRCSNFLIFCFLYVR